MFAPWGWKNRRAFQDHHEHLWIIQSSVSEGFSGSSWMVWRWKNTRFRNKNIGNVVFQARFLGVKIKKNTCLIDTVSFLKTFSLIYSCCAVGMWDNWDTTSQNQRLTMEYKCFWEVWQVQGCQYHLFGWFAFAIILNVEVNDGHVWPYRTCNHPFTWTIC